MFFELFLAFFLGIVAGTITGLIPGVHINLISTLIISYAYLLYKYFTPLGLGVFIMSMSVTSSSTSGCIITPEKIIILDGI